VPVADSSAALVTVGAADAQLARGEQLLHERGDLAGSRPCFASAFDLADDAEQRARAALGEGGLWLHERRSAADAARVESHQRTALMRIAPSSPLSLRLQVRLVAEADYRAGDCAGVLALLERARRCDDPVVLADALNLAHHCLLGPQHVCLRAALADDLLLTGSRTGRRSDVMLGLLWRTVDLHLAGDAHADRSFAELVDAERATPSGAVGYVIAAIRVTGSIRAGRWAEAEQLAVRCAQYGEAAGDQDTTGWFGAQMFAIRWYQGRAAQLTETVAQLAASPTLSVVDNAFLAAQAVAAAQAGDRRQARGALARLGDLADLPRSSSWLVALCGVVEAAALLDDPESAEAAYRLLLPYAELPAMASLAVACFGSVEHALGVAALVTGDPERAAGHLTAAVTRNEALGHWPAVTLSKARLGQALGRLGDRTAARRRHAEAAAEAAACGMALPPSARPRAVELLTCTRQGTRWRIALGARVAVVDDSIGLRHLAVLIAGPGVDVPAVQLTRPGRPAPARVAQPVLDGAAVRQYRNRLDELRQQIEHAESLGASDRATGLRSEAAWIAGELHAQTGLGGRSRLFADDAERARIAVGKAIRRAVTRVGEADPVIGAELSGTIRTGRVCCYRPAELP
jgi:hypothetical protein